MRPPPPHLLREWERWPDLFVLNPSLKDARRIAKALQHWTGGLMSRPIVTESSRAQLSYCEPAPYKRWRKLPCLISMRAGFTLGELVHEMTHAWMFWGQGDHKHGRRFDWFYDRLAQAVYELGWVVIPS